MSIELDVSETPAEVTASGPQLRDYLRFFTPRRLAKALYGVVVCIILGEVGIALISPRQEVLPKELVVRDKELGFRMVANYRGVEPKTGIPLHTNSQGMRERELGPPSAGTLRVYVLGDSIVFGLGVTAEDAFPRALERELRARLGRPVEVINGGVPGYGTLQELKLFEGTVGALKPDVVLITLAVFNDVADNVKFVVPEKRWQNTPKGIYRPLRWLRQRSQIYLMTRRYRSGVSAEKMMDIHAVAPSAATARGLEITEQSLRSLADAARKHGVEFGIVLAPAQKQVSQQLWDETLRGHGLDPALYAYDMPSRRFSEYAEREQLPLLDLLPVLRAGNDGIYENEHWNPQGHSLVARAIADFLAEHEMGQAS
jgi:lysophospholipase L1-like esterase